MQKYAKNLQTGALENREIRRLTRDNIKDAIANFFTVSFTKIE